MKNTTEVSQEEIDTSVVFFIQLKINFKLIPQSCFSSNLKSILSNHLFGDKEKEVKTIKQFVHMLYVSMPDIRTSKKRIDVRKLMRNLRRIKDDEKAPNKTAKRTLCFNELIEAKQDGTESVSTYLNRYYILFERFEINK